MIKLTAFLVRNPAFTPAEFDAYWRTHHAALCTEVLGPYVRRYVQRPVFAEPGHWAAQLGYDGVAEQWFDSMADFERMIADPAYLEKVRPDEDKLLDMSQLKIVLTDEPRVVIDGDAT